MRVRSAYIWDRVVEVGNHVCRKTPTRPWIETLRAPAIIGISPKLDERISLLERYSDGHAVVENGWRHLPVEKLPESHRHRRQEHAVLARLNALLRQ